MANETALNIVNKVMRRLRVTEVSSFTDSYTKLILDFVNETKREVGDAWNWTVFRSIITVTTVNGTTDYALTAGGTRFRVLDVYNYTNKYILTPMNENYYNQFALTNSLTTQAPNNYKINSLSGTDLTVTLFPTPDAAYDIKFRMVIPEEDFVTTTDTTVLPSEPIVLGAWARAISERGEDGGQNTSEQWNMYRNSLGDHIAIDVSMHPTETDWQVC